MPAQPSIVAMGGGGFSMEPENPLLDRFVLELAARRAGPAGHDPTRPRACFIGTASGDAATYIEDFHAAFDAVAEADHLGLFDRTVGDIEAFLVDQDLIYVGGGNTANMLAIWRLHGVDQALRAAWKAGVVLTGLSAGSNCWFEAATTDSYGPNLAPLIDGLGFLPGSHSPHYDGEAQRRPLYQRLISEGSLPAGYAADDGAALVFRGTDLAECVSSRPDATCYRVEPASGGGVSETRLATRYLAQ